MAIKAIKLPNPLANILARDSWPVTLLRSAPILFCVGAMIVPFYTSDYAILAAPGGSIILCDFVYVTLVALCQNFSDNYRRFGLLYLCLDFWALFPIDTIED